MAVLEAVASSALLGAAALGFRHGFDVDHLAALTDLTGSQRHPRRSMWLASMYIAGHAAMLLVLGAAAVLFAERIPAGVDVLMGRVVGATLVGLGLWMAWTAVRAGGVPPLRSRWMPIIDAVRRWRAPRRPDVVIIEHSHPHDHRHGLHDHLHRLDDGGHPGDRSPVVVAHAHRHRHVLDAPRDPWADPGTAAAFGIGLLHGVGAETPTQLLVLAAAASATGTAGGLGLLACFVVGLAAANTVVASASTVGYQRLLRNRWVAGVLAVGTAVFSLVVGVGYLVG